MNSRRTYGFDLQTHDGSDLKVTFVVAGNIYISDNIFQPADETMIAMIAIENSSITSEELRAEESGNIYIGDPIFGTIEDSPSSSTPRTTSTTTTSTRMGRGRSRSTAP